MISEGNNEPDGLQRLLWFSFTVFFGLRVVDEQETMKFGDIKLSIVENRECLTFTERGSKTSNGNGPSRAEPPRAFSFSGFFKTHNFKISNKTELFQRILNPVPTKYEIPTKKVNLHAFLQFQEKKYNNHFKDFLKVKNKT